jgi:hypothetical protein
MRPTLGAALICWVSILTSAGAALAANASPDPAASAQVSPAPETSGILGAATEVYREGFDQAAAWVDLGADESGRTDLENGALSMSVKGSDVNYVDWYELDEPAAVLRVESLIDIDGRDGTAGGVACGSSLGLPRWFVAGVNNADEWFLARRIDGRLQIVDRGVVMLPSTPSRRPVSVAIECAQAPLEGGDYVAVSVDGRPVDIETGLGRLDIPVGPFGRAGLFVATDAGTASAVYDEMTVAIGDVLARQEPERDADLPSE